MIEYVLFNGDDKPFKFYKPKLGDAPCPKTLKSLKAVRFKPVEQCTRVELEDTYRHLHNQSMIDLYGFKEIKQVNNKYLYKD